MSGSPIRARLSRVDLPAETAARLFSTSPPCGFQVDVGQRLQQRPLGRRIEVAAGFQVVGQAPGLVERPGLEGGHELALVDEAVLKGEQSEQEMTVGGAHGETPDRDGVTPRWATVPKLGRRAAPRPTYCRTNPHAVHIRRFPVIPDRVRPLPQKEHASTGCQNPSAIARARRLGYGTLCLDARRPAHDSRCLGVKDGLKRTVCLNRCRRRSLIIRTDCRVALRFDQIAAPSEVAYGLVSARSAIMPPHLICT